MTTPLVPLYYDGQDRRTEPIAVKSHKDIKLERKTGKLNGWYQENGRVFVVYRPPFAIREWHEVIAGSGFDQAWKIRQSGPDGPLVWQMNRGRTNPQTA